MPSSALAGVCPQNQAILWFLSLVSCTCSVALTVNFCWHLRSDASVFAGIVAVALGVSWEVAKYAFAPRALRLLQSHRPSLMLGGVGLMAVTSILVGGSVVASLGYLLQSDADQHRRDVEVSRSYRDAQAQVEALDAEIAVIRRVAAEDVRRHFRARAMEMMTRVDELRRRRESLNLVLQGMEAPLRANASFFGSLAAVIDTWGRPQGGTTADAIRMAAYGLVALMLELISICSVVLWGARIEIDARIEADSSPCIDFDAPDRAISCGDAGEKIHRDHIDKINGRGDTGTRRGVDSRYQRAKELIATGRIRPTVRAVQKAMAVSQEPARRFLAALCGEGILVRQNNRYQLC